MFLTAARVPVVLLAIASSSAIAAGPQAGLLDRPKATSKHADFKVVVWYRLDRPLDTFKYQVYDLRKGQYTAAVDAWIELMRTKYPGYYLAIRDVRLGHEQGDTEMLKVGAVVKRELMAVAALEGVVVGYGVPRYQVPTISPSNYPPHTDESPQVRSSRLNS